MTIDTNILIAHLQGEDRVIRALSLWKLSGRALFVSTITRAEVLARFDLTSGEIEHITQFLENFLSISFDDHVADVAANLRRRYKIALPDAGIAATAIVCNTPLVTRNQRDFRKINELQILVI